MGRRIPSWNKNKIGSAKKHIFGFGCSVTYGHGVNDDETFLAQLTKDEPSIVSYNAAFEGYGPGENLIRAKKTALLSKVTPSTGIGIYFYLPFHFERFFNSATLTGSWRPNGLVMNEIAEGKFEAIGSVENERPLWTLFSKWWANDPLIKIFSLNLPLKTDKRVSQMVRAISELKFIYQEKTSPNNPFIIVLMPDYSKDTQFIQHLDKAQLPFIDYSGLNMEKKLKGPKNLPGDLHPSPEYHKIFAQMLKRDIASFLK